MRKNKFIYCKFESTVTKMTNTTKLDYLKNI